MKSSRFLGAIKQHPLLRLLIHSKGNLKTLLLLEPLWGIPFSLIAPLAARYMSLQGITDEQIGLFISISMVFKVIFSFSGGIISDKIGRKPATVYGDLFGWVFACLAWAVSSNFWFFLAAILLNSIESVNQTAWHCLLIEDAPQKDVLGIFNWLYIGAYLSVFFAPISGMLIGMFSLIPTVRWLYFLFAVSMMIKTAITYFRTTETQQGLIRIAETKTMPVRKMLYEYKGLIPKIFRNRMTVKMMAVGIVLQAASTVSSNFFGLYVPGRLGIADTYLPLFPILTAAVMLVFLFGVQHRLERFGQKAPMWIGLGIFAANQVLLILVPVGNIFLVFVYTFFGAVANALVMPRKETLLIQSIDTQERARITALLTAFTVAFASPAGYLAGVLSEIDQRLPFALICLLFVVAIVIVGSVRENQTVGEGLTAK